MNRTGYDQILPELVMPPEQRVFPEPANPAALDEKLAALGGAVAAMPRRCITIGMKSILVAKELRLYCFRDWHRAVVRQAGYGEISASFPVTLAQNHPDARITITKNVAEAAY